PNLHDSICCLVRASQHGSYARDQFADRKWLRDVVVGAEVEADDSVCFFAPGGEEDDRGGQTFLARAAADLEAAQLRQHHVKDHQVGSFVSEEALSDFA